MRPTAAALLQDVPTLAATADGPTFDWVGPIAGTGMVGIFLLLVILRIKIMPTYVYDEAKADWERERQEMKESLEDARRALQDGNKVYTEQVIPTLTRALDAERELLDLRRQEAQRRDWAQHGGSHGR